MNDTDPNIDTGPHPDAAHEGLTGGNPGQSGGHLDGNVLAGSLSVVFAADLTTATAVCAGCGQVEQVAALPVFGAPMGLIARCPGCDRVLLSYTELRTGRTLEMHGIATLRLPPI
jgi:Family of unknown function (DUF6510)